MSLRNQMNTGIGRTLNALRVLLTEKVAKAPFLANLREAALKNTDFRRVIYTGSRIQFTLMAIPSGGEIGTETHENVEQVFFCVAGSGATICDGESRPCGPGDVLVVPPRTKHNIENTGTSPLKFYTSYSPPNHLPETVHPTKADADTDAADEKFGQKVASES
jgi:mannose-6-phosphate isomerase-like protein (cupin superfamily)